MEKDQRKRSRAVDGGGGSGDGDAVKYLDKGGGGVGVKLPEVAREVVEGEVCVKKKTDVVLLDLNTVPDEG
nr:hypothetical protein [Tanacetum cinerariifolium]